MLGRLVRSAADSDGAPRHRPRSRSRSTGPQVASPQVRVNCAVTLRLPAPKAKVAGASRSEERVEDCSLTREIGIGTRLRPLRSMLYLTRELPRRGCGTADD